MSKLTIDKPVTVTLEPDELAFVLDCVAEGSYKRAQPIFEKMVAAVRAAHAPAPPDPQRV